ncbi:hypothetical protein OG426_52970 [Streptomyces canus]|nr:hypothetical protein OG426_52970 [Streptomyces canus]
MDRGPDRDTGKSADQRQVYLLTGTVLPAGVAFAVVGVVALAI